MSVAKVVRAGKVANQLLRDKDSLENNINRSYNYYFPELYEHYLKYIPIDVETILDVGCGKGEFIELLNNKGFKVKACDIDLNVLSFIIKRGLLLKKDLKKIDAMELSNYYEPNSFDLITFLHTLEHVNNPFKALSEINKITRKYLLLAVPNVRYAFTELASHLYSFNQITLRNLLIKAGFKVLLIKGDGMYHLKFFERFNPVFNRIFSEIIPAPKDIICLCKKL